MLLARSLVKSRFTGSVRVLAWTRGGGGGPALVVALSPGDVPVLALPRARARSVSRLSSGAGPRAGRFLIPAADFQAGRPGLPRAGLPVSIDAMQWTMGNGGGGRRLTLID
jgi:hypothetical protein